MTTTHALILIIVAALATFATRVTPFLFLSRHSAHPLILHMGRYLPAIVMTVLVAVSLSAMTLPVFEVSTDDLPTAWQHWLMSAKGAGMLISAICVAGLHLWRRNALLSIAVGTGIYMAWVQIGTPAVVG
ncbi:MULTISPECIES: branched-chain amino acid transporter permease [Cobetia]|uniref:Branched-chain amino acid transporter n=1 Tax=Cobetia crustatorum TaxID=553385 RepID=A0A558HKS1_9GAMM|nr:MULTISPECIES: AzlD domain-containing protein [Cobetia]TVU69729.1 branched-chain amino acid transporter [Cobetia crustatorum]